MKCWVITAALLLSPLLVEAAPRSWLLADARESSDFSHSPRGGLLLAQADIDDSYDPFADYSEFEESMEEEEDINFFRNGRLFTIGFLLGQRGWTQNFAQFLSQSSAFGLYLAYFFDLRFALQISYLTSDHTLSVRGTSSSVPVSGAISITDIGLTLKFYFNTQNVTRGLADLNPYLLIGFSEIFRTFSYTGNDLTSKDATMGFDAGLGIEIPIMRNKMYFGLQFMYQLVNFPDEGKIIQDQNEALTGVLSRGDTWNGLLVLGTNF